MLSKCCTQMPANLENSVVATGLESECQFSFQSQRKAMPKNAQTTTQLHSSHMLAKQCSKFSKPGFNSMSTVNFQMFKLDLEKTEEPEIKLPTTAGSSKKQESSGKTSISALLTMPKPLTGEWQPTPVFLPGESHGQRSLVGYSPWGHKVGHDWAHSTSLWLCGSQQTLENC